MSSARGNPLEPLQLDTHSIVPKFCSSHSPEWSHIRGNKVPWVVFGGRLSHRTSKDQRHVSDWNRLATRGEVRWLWQLQVHLRNSVVQLLSRNGEAALQYDRNGSLLDVSLKPKHLILPFAFSASETKSEAWPLSSYRTPAARTHRYSG